MMTTNPRERKTVTEMLDHPFFEKYPQNVALPQPEELEKTSKKIGEFMKYTRFEKFIVSMVYSLNANKEQIRQLNAQFEAIDTDKNGTLSVSEINQACKDSNISSIDYKNLISIFESMDLDGDNKISCAEFINVAAD